MSKKDITTSDKLAKAKAMRIIETKKGTKGIEVAFEFIEPSTGLPEYLEWQGWLTEKATEFTMRTLVEILDYNGSEDLDANGVFTDPNVIDFNKEVKLVVEIEENTTEDGKTYRNPRIKYVNNTGGGSQYAGVNVTTIKADLGAIGFKAAYLAARQGAGKSTREVKNHAEPFFNKDETVPF